MGCCISHDKVYTITNKYATNTVIAHTIIIIDIYY